MVLVDGKGNIFRHVMGGIFLFNNIRRSQSGVYRCRETRSSVKYSESIRIDVECKLIF